MKASSFFYLWMSLTIATLIMLFPQTVYATGVSTEEINNAIVLEGSLPLTWENDKNNPWALDDGKLRSTNTQTFTSSSIKFSFYNESVCILSLSTQNSAAASSASAHRHYVYIDGVSQAMSYSYTQGVNNIEVRLPKGQHSVEVKDIIGNALGYYTKLFDVKVTEQEAASGDEITQAIVQDGSIPLTWTNDIEYPWYVSDGKVRSSNNEIANTTSQISFTYTSDVPTTLSFKTSNHLDVNTSHHYNYHNHYVYLDGKQIASNYNSSSYPQDRRLPKGTHTVTIKDEMLDNSYDYYTTLYDIKVTEQKGSSDSDIINTIVSAESIPLYFTNDSDSPWYVENGMVRSNNDRIANTTSQISFTYTSDVPTTLSFKTSNHLDVNTSHHYNYHNHYVYLDGKQIASNYNSSSYPQDRRLPKGTHTVTIKDEMLDNSYDYYTTLYDIKVIESKGASADEISNAIVLEGSVPLIWTNDNNCPWYINTEGKLESNNYGLSNSASEISFGYETNKPTIVTLTYNVKGSSSSSNIKHECEIYLNGKYRTRQYQYESGITSTFYSPIGSNTITLRDSIYNTTDYGYRSNLWDVKVVDIPDLETVILNPKSNPLKFENSDKDYPWYIVDEAARSSYISSSNSTSSIKATVTITEVSKLSYDYRIGYNNGSSNNDHILGFYINGEQYKWFRTQTSWNSDYILLEPGTYTFEWKYQTTTTGSNYWGEVKNVCLTDNWTTVATTPGMLGVETLYEVDRLQDVEMLRVSGQMNSTDWSTIDKMTNLVALDMTNVDIQDIPANRFKSLERLRLVRLPNTLETIGDYAFYECNLTNINIPASVKKIGAYAFQSNILHTLTFEENSSLTTIGVSAFERNGNLREIIMPNSVTSLGSRAFYGISRLKNLHISEGLTTLESYVFRGATDLTSVVLPRNITSIGEQAFCAASLTNISLPNNVKSIGISAFASNELLEITIPSSVTTISNRAFYNNHIKSVTIPETVTSLGTEIFDTNPELEYVELPSGLSSYSNQFTNCPDIKRIVCHSATPPTISGDPFNSVAKANVTLEVPSFAIATYKLDSYWYKFGSIIGGALTDYWKIIGDLKLLNNRRMEGKPDIDLYYGGKLTVGGDAPMEVGQFDIYTSETNPSSLVSDCNAFTADEINTIFSVAANKWYFITPMVDIDLRQVNVSGTSNYVFRYYDGATRADIGSGSSWKNVSDMKLKAGIGYIFQCDAASVITFPVSTELRSSILSTEPVTLPLVAHPSESNAHKGWNYVGNPYPSYYDIYYMDFTAPITVWTGSTYRAYSIADDNYVLRPMQGFFVQKPDAVDAITLQVAGRQVESTVNRSSSANVRSRVATKSVRAIFDLEIGGDETADVTRVVLNENAELGYEIERDASKFMSMDYDVAQIYTIDDSENKLAINERPTDDGIVNLGIYIPNSNDEYIISASRMEGNAILVDKENGTQHDLANGGYRFTTMSEGTCDGRFVLKLKSDITSGISGISAGNVVIEAVADGIIVKGAENLIIYTTDGIQLYNNASVNGDVQIELAKGIYIAVANGKSYKVAVK